MTPITATAFSAIHPLTLAVISLGAQMEKMDVEEFIVLAAYRCAQEKIAEFESLGGTRSC